MPAARRRSTGQHNKKKRKTLAFEPGQRVHVVGGTHKGRKGQVVKTTKKFAVVKTRVRAAVVEETRVSDVTRESYTAQKQIFQPRFLRVGIENLEAHVVQEPKRTRKSKRTDPVSRKISQLGKLTARHHADFVASRKPEGKHFLTERERGILDTQITKLQGELRKISSAKNRVSRA